MKKTAILMAFSASLVVGVSVPAHAGGPFVVNGRWAGTAFANPSFDFNGDGVAARTFDVKTFDQLPFGGFEGVVDTGLVSVGTCAGPGSLELQPFGKFTFRGRLGDGLYAEVDPLAPNLCFDPANPNETVVIRIVGGTGVYQNASGTGALTLHDVVRVDKPTIIPGVPFPVPAPLMVDTRGEFVLHVNL
jgi:hypothetical protein